MPDKISRQANDLARLYQTRKSCMSSVKNVISIWKNGQSFPHGWPVGLENNSEEIGSLISKRWEYREKTFELKFSDTNYNRYSFELLPDDSGFFILDENMGKQAYILNGDATIRFVLEPFFNMRKFDVARLAEMRLIAHDEAKRQHMKYVPFEEQARFHHKTERVDVLEIFGDDGLGDCFYEYDFKIGELLSARTLPRRS